jgi:D-lactate dehydrogenase
MRIGFFELEGWEADIIRGQFPSEQISFYEEKIDPLTLPAENDFEILSIFVNSRLSREVLAHFPNLKLIVTRSVGYDHIDLKACAERGIAVSYVPGYGDNTVAEFAFGLILNLTRKIYQGIDQIKESGSFSLKGLRGIDLKGKTIGIVGTGRIGREMVKIAKGFGMKVLAYDPFPNLEFAKELDFEYVDFETLLRGSDIISLHCPHNEKTHHLINKENIGLIKRGAYLINTARGPILETDALIQALQAGILSGAGLDVLEEEGETKDELAYLSQGRPNEEELRTMLQNHILMEMPNVLITPHTAFNSKEAMERILMTTIDNIRGFLEGKPINVVP